MTDPASPKKVIRFGEFEVDLPGGCLFKSGAKVKLRQQLFAVLSVLLEHAGEVVTREELERRLWPGDVVVDFDLNLNTAIAQLREALGDSVENPRYIETLPKRGYRFLATSSQGAASEPVQHHRTRIVVLPFANESGDPAEEYFSDTMTDEIITALCQVAPEPLAVIARTTAMHYKNSAKDVAQIGHELGVDYVLEGGVRRSDGHVAMNMQLIQASDQTHVFARKYDVEMAELFGLQNRIAEDVIAHIPSVSGLRAGGRARKKPTEDLEAYRQYLQGRALMYRLTPDRVAKAKECFEKAIARDPRFALAYDALGEANWWTAFFGFAPPREACFVGFGAALKAVEIDPTLAETHTLLGQFRQKVDYNWPDVLREMMLAMDMDPSSPVVRTRYAVSYLLPQGRLKEAVSQVERALEFDPVHWLPRFWLVTFLWLDRDYERAMREARVFQELFPANYMPPFMIANIYREQGMFDEAVAYHRRAVEMSGGVPQMLGWLGLTLALGGNPTEARSLIQRLEAIAAKAYVSPTCFAVIYVGLGETDNAFIWLDRAIDDRDSIMIPIRTYAFFDPLRADPRFAALLRRMNLEP